MPLKTPNRISLLEQSNFQRAYLTQSNLKSCKLGSIWNKIPRYFLWYLEGHITHPELVFMVGWSLPKKLNLILSNSQIFHSFQTLFFLILALSSCRVLQYFYDGYYFLTLCASYYLITLLKFFFFLFQLKTFLPTLNIICLLRWNSNLITNGDWKLELYKIECTISHTNTSYSLLYWLFKRKRY